ncbi:lactate racemase domain-containing protein [Metallumcola ferriviriculae]|uniref:Lactate racemase domain-containing protein n=1 Tax=Metallumcola ferriviriculae TaxID=3039180 RepID=A0AAU0UN35_9FIRM|nr:lactate racemase domain-containing protein [Desulfitibacteraceae bacterium MK1]
MSIFPKMVKVKLHYKTPELDDISAELKRQLQESTVNIKSGAKIGIAVGSRGIYKTHEFVKTLIAFLKEKGAQPVIIPAMGSHGGANSDGQKEVLAGYGISEEEMGVPVQASMTTIYVGTIDEDVPVYFDKIASTLDGIILLNRVKPHTDFHAEYESGLMKQMVIGLGNHKGAQNVHSYGIYGLKELIPQSARLILEKMPILMGVAIIENAKDHTAEIHVVEAEEIPKTEPMLLEKAKDLMPYLPFKHIDLLVVQEVGKNISGVGIDPNITGRTFIRFAESEQNFINRIVCLDLTPESHGNALGIGIADVVPQRIYDKIDFKATYANVITSGFLERGFIPIVQGNDYKALKVALKCCGRKVTPENAKVVQIKNTLQLEEIYISEALLKEIKSEITWDIEEKFSYKFSDKGDLLHLLR